MKRIDMPPGDRNATAAQSGGMWYGRVVYSPGGMPPCAGNLGVGGVPDDPGGGRAGRHRRGRRARHRGRRVALHRDPGDGGAGLALREDPRCGVLRRGPRVHLPRRGRRGHGPGRDARERVQDHRNPAAQADDPAVFDVTARRELFANAITAVGDVGACTTPAIPAGERCPFTGVTSTTDGRPEVLISGFRVDLPMNDPDGSMPDVGVNFLVDGASGAILNTYHHPEPQAGAIFGSGVGGIPVGDLGGDTVEAGPLPPAVTQNGTYKAQGRGYVMSGDLGRVHLDDQPRADQRPDARAGGQLRRRLCRARQPRRPDGQGPQRAARRRRQPRRARQPRARQRHPRVRPAQGAGAPEHRRPRRRARQAASAPISRRSVTSTATGCWISSPPRLRTTAPSARARAGSTSCAATTRPRPPRRPRRLRPRGPRVRPARRARPAPRRRRPGARSSSRRAAKRRAAVRR